MASKYNISKIINSIMNNKKEDEENNLKTTQETNNDNTSTSSLNENNQEVKNNNATSNNQNQAETNTPKTITAYSTSSNETSSQTDGEDQTSKTSDTDSKSVANILTELKDIERNYSQNDYVDAPESLGLQTVDVPEKTEEELLSLAKASLESKYNQKAETTNDSFAKQIESLLASKENAQKTAEQKTQQITSTYDNSIKETEAQALKRGLARSSIIISQIAGLEGEKASELSGVLSNLQDNLLESENQINKLESELQVALNNLDLEYAVELETEIENARTEYEKARQEAIEFNNNVAKLEAEYKLKLDQQKLNKQSELTQLENKYGADYTKNLIATEQYNYLKNYLDTLDKDYAISLLLTNKEFQSILGDRYSELYQYLRSK